MSHDLLILKSSRASSLLQNAGLFLDLGQGTGFTPVGASLSRELLILKGSRASSLLQSAGLFLDLRAGHGIYPCRSELVSRSFDLEKLARQARSYGMRGYFWIFGQGTGFTPVGAIYAPCLLFLQGVDQCPQRCGDVTSIAVINVKITN